MLNNALKEFIAKPLSLEININGWAMPSGHMQASSLLWAYMIFIFPQKQIKLFIGLLIITIGWALIAKGYHDIFDVIVGLLIGITIAVLYFSLINKWHPPVLFLILCINLVTTVIWFFTDFNKTVLFLVLSWVWLLIVKLCKIMNINV